MLLDRAYWIVPTGSCLLEHVLSKFVATASSDFFVFVFCILDRQGPFWDPLGNMDGWLEVGSSQMPTSGPFKCSAFGARQNLGSSDVPRQRLSSANERRRYRPFRLLLLFLFLFFLPLCSDERKENTEERGEKGEEKRGERREQRAEKREKRKERREKEVGLRVYVFTLNRGMGQCSAQKHSWGYPSKYKLPPLHPTAS